MISIHHMLARIYLLVKKLAETHRIQQHLCCYDAKMPNDWGLEQLAICPITHIRTNDKP
jgi:hypothetical protein